LVARLENVRRDFRYHIFLGAAAMAEDQLPPIVQKLQRDQPQVWDAYNRLGEALGQAGPLDARTEHLVKLAIAIGAGLQGAVGSHTRRSLADGLTRAELEHVALLAVTTVGWPSAVAAYSWIEEEFAKRGQ
jgi:alkylhydroperoxidase/carboxymuconolactone decarboxylase family protein YurZ